MATGGHVQTLPFDRTQHGKDAKKAYWANRPGKLPSPPWVWTDRGEEAVQAILAEANEETTFWLATDPDREGEFIAWCLDRILRPHARAVHRVSFQEVTEEAVREALERPRPVDTKMVESALIRKLLDRLVGYRTSKLARGVIPGSASASMGRVQTPTLGFVVDRELEREAHVPIPYFEVRARAEEVDLQVRFHEPGDEEAWKNEAGRAVPTRTFDEGLARRAEDAIRQGGRVQVTEATRGSRTSAPRPPFSTDALLQAAGSRFGWSPKKTSALASMLYEAGHITYIRTDSNRLAASAIQAARKVVAETFGEEHLGRSGGTRTAPAGGGAVQDAHEAIRPTRFQEEDVPLKDADARKLYRLVRAHTLASQMAASRYDTVRIRAEAKDLDRPLTGSVSWRTFPGWEAAYAEFRAQPATSPPPAPLEVGAIWELEPESPESPNPELIEDETQPPPRYRRHTLIRTMKDAGIGRPSTYSKTVEKLEERAYVEIEDGALVPTERGRSVWLQVAPLYVRDDSGTELFSAAYTALMESRLDAVASGGSNGNGSEKATPENGGENGSAGEAVDPASMWESWRDEIRDLHEIARTRTKEGKATPRTRQQLQRLLENAPSEMERPPPPDSLSEQDARGWVERLRQAGVQPAPTETQMDYLRALMEELQLDPSEAAELVDLDDISRIRTSSQASSLIDDLRRLRDERRPPSRKQLALIERLRKDAGLTEAQTAELIDEPDLEGLTGGREGTASALIDRLLEVTGTSAAKGS